MCYLGNTKNNPQVRRVVIIIPIITEEETELHIGWPEQAPYLESSLTLTPS
jgi:hypothetical protein